MKRSADCQPRRAISQVMPLARSIRPSAVPNELLARKAANGDERALAALLRRYQQELYRVSAGLPLRSHWNS
jgi:hypothetical protein